MLLIYCPKYWLLDMKAWLISYVHPWKLRYLLLFGVLILIYIILCSKWVMVMIVLIRAQTRHKPSSKQILLKSQKNSQVVGLYKIMSWRISSDFWRQILSYVGLEFKTKTYEQSSSQKVYSWKKRSIYKYFLIMINKCVNTRYQFHVFLYFILSSSLLIVINCALFQELIWLFHGLPFSSSCGVELSEWMMMMFWLLRSSDTVENTVSFCFSKQISGLFFFLFSFSYPPLKCTGEYR